MPKHKKEKAGPGMRHQPLATQVGLEHLNFELLVGWGGHRIFVVFSGLTS